MIFGDVISGLFLITFIKIGVLTAVAIFSHPIKD
jgi:hypothetical protein